MLQTCLARPTMKRPRLCLERPCSARSCHYNGTDVCPDPQGSLRGNRSQLRPWYGGRLGRNRARCASRRSNCGSCGEAGVLTGPQVAAGVRYRFKAFGAGDRQRFSLGAAWSYGTFRRKKDTMRRIFKALTWPTSTLATRRSCRRRARKF